VWTRETARWEGNIHDVDASNIVKVDPSKVPCLANWKRDYNMETILIELRRYNCQVQTEAIADALQVYGPTATQEAPTAQRRGDLLISE
jgi:hypothetical protein